MLTELMDNNEKRLPSPLEQAVFLTAMGAIGVTSAGLDLLSKWIATSVLTPYQTVELLPGLLDFRLTKNPNGSFGLFASFPLETRLLLIPLLSLLASGAVTTYALKTLKHTRMLSVALGLLLGGAAANVVDRLSHGEVTDFIRLHAGSFFECPTLNLADLCITCGSFLMLPAAIGQWLNRRKQEKQIL
jgi:signal peptidase II